MGYKTFFSPTEVGLFRDFGGRYDTYAAINDLFLDDSPDDEYFKYSADQDRFVSSEFPHLLLVGEEGKNEGDGIYLINPLHKDDSGEFESMLWFLGRTEWVVRYPTFAHLVVQKYFYDMHLIDENREWNLYDNIEEIKRSPFSRVICV